MDDRTGDRFLLVGGGIASLAAAVFLIRDAGVPGGRIRILDAGDRPGGALLSGPMTEHPDLYIGTAVRGMEARGYTCLWDLLGAVPTLADPDKTVLDEIRETQRESPIEAKARLIGADHRIARADPHLEQADRAALLALLDRPEPELSALRIDQVLPAHLLASDFWILWTTTFRLKPGSSALDLKHSLLHHLRDLPRLDTLAELRRTRRSEHESIIRPLHRWLDGQGVAFTFGATVTDMEFADDGAGSRWATALSFTTLGRTHTLKLGARDHVLATLGSMTANAAHGDDDDPPEPDLARRDETWRLWESISRRQPDLGRPDVFTSRVQDTAWLSFTLTMTTPDLTWYISNLTGNRAGTGGLVTFRDSPWLLTLAVPRQPHFTRQVPEVQTALGYGLRLDVDGDYAPVSMLRASGRQLVEELIGQFGIERRAANVRMTTSVRSVLLPYAGSPLAPRRPGDRPLPVPAGARNFAFLGQYVEIPGETAFSMDYSVRSAMHAVYGLLGIEREPLGHGAGPGLDGAGARAVLETMAG
jgi:oleate hydratase